MKSQGNRSSEPTVRWSGIRESNPRLDLGKVAYYHYTNPARRLMRHNFYSMRLAREQVPARKSVMELFATRTSRLGDCACATRALAKGNEGDRKIATRRTVRNAMRGCGSTV